MAEKPEYHFPPEKAAILKNYPVSFRIRKLRTTFNLSQDEFARTINYVQTTVAAWENDVSKPSPRAAEKIISTFDLPWDFFMDLEIQTVKFGRRKDDKK